MFILTTCSIYTKLVFPNGIFIASRKSWELSAGCNHAKDPWVQQNSCSVLYEYEWTLLCTGRIGNLGELFVTIAEPDPVHLYMITEMLKAFCVLQNSALQP